MSANIKRVALRYPGGKYKQAKEIVSYFPEHRIYCEPYGGAASVLLRKRRSYAEVYNDIDGEIVNFFRVLRDRGAELQASLRLTPYARFEFDQSYEPDGCELEQARRTVVRSFMGFGSGAAKGNATGFRSFARKQSTGPASDWKNYPNCMPALIERMQGVVIENRTAIEVIERQDSEETLHYVDPPYVLDTRTAGLYADDEMSDGQHLELAECLKRLKGMVVLSGYMSDMYAEVYDGWHCIQYKAIADGAKDRIECLWLNQLAFDNQRQMSLFNKAA
jgi:DNA adenine methylase